MSHDAISTLDLEDLTPRQLRKLLNGVVRSQLPYAKKTKEEKEKQAEEDGDESESLADLHEEKKGDSKAPKVTASDFRAVDKEDEEEDEANTVDALTKKKKA